MKHVVGRSRFQRVTIPRGSVALRCVAVFRELASFEHGRTGETVVQLLDEGGAVWAENEPIENIDFVFGWPARNSAKIRALQAAWTLHHQEKG